MSGKERENSVGAKVTVSGRLFQIDGPATGNTPPPTVDSLMNGTNWNVRSGWKDMRVGP